MTLRFLTRYSLRLSLMVGGLLLSSSLATPTFASDEEKTLGILPTYSLCMKQADGSSYAAADCDGVESEYQDWRLNTAYKALMKELSPAEQKTLRQKERNWLKKRHAICSKTHTKKPGALSCSLSMIAHQAGVLENLLKEHKK